MRLDAGAGRLDGEAEQARADVRLPVAARPGPRRPRPGGLAARGLRSQREELLDAPIEERTPGGLGVHLVKASMDEVIYRRDGSRNVLTMKTSVQSRDSLA